MARWRSDTNQMMRRSPVGRGLVVASAIVLALLVIAGVATLPISMRWYDVQNLDSAVRHAPSARPVVGFERFGGESASDRSRGLNPAARGSASFVIRWAHQATSWMGHDDLGRSLLFRLLPGFVVSLAIGLAAAGVSVAVGATWGMIAGYVGGRVDLVMMRVVDVLYGLPYILMVILLKIALSEPLAAALGGHSRIADIVILFIAIGGVSWMTMARVVRGQVLSLREQPFVEAARAAGAGPVHIMRRHLLPNLIGPIVTYAMLVIPQAILQESFLSFLGIGVQQPTPSLGRLAADGVEAVNTFVGYWWLIVFPCATLVVTLVALNFLGDALRDRFDPKSGAATLV